MPCVVLVDLFISRHHHAWAWSISSRLAVKPNRAPHLLIYGFRVGATLGGCVRGPFRNFIVRVGGRRPPSLERCFSENRDGFAHRVGARWGPPSKRPFVRQAQSPSVTKCMVTRKRRRHLAFEIGFGRERSCTDAGHVEHVSRTQMLFCRLPP